MVKKKSVKEAEDAVRDAINWLQVLKTDHKVSTTALKLMRAKLNKIASKIGKIE